MDSMKNSIIKVLKVSPVRFYVTMSGMALLCVSLLVGCGNAGTGISSELDRQCDLLDEEIAQSEKYDKAKERRIAGLRSSGLATKDEEERTNVINRLVTEFEAYNADSALYYINLNLSRPVIGKHPDRRMRLLIKKADLYAHAGLFPEALSVIENLRRDSVPEDMLEDYYSTYCGIYQYMSEYADETEAARKYEGLRSAYVDSVRHYADHRSFNYQIYALADMARGGESQNAIEELSRHLDEYPSGSREYSIIASTLAYIYKTTGKDELYKRFIVLSAISDVQGAVKENMSFRELATAMYEAGDVERANRYLKKSFADANFFSARMRNAQSSKMLPVIDEAYASSQDSLTRRLRLMVGITSVLLLILLCSIWFILRQMKRLRQANVRVRNVNAELSSLSDEVKEKNIQLKAQNDKLSGFNHIMEQYSAMFMEYCSSAISALQRYQMGLRVLAMQSGKRQALLDKIDSSEMADSLLKDFYSKFDEAILTFYPAFVDKVNVLLREDGRIQLKQGELLNTELRILALIKMGIDDSTKISEFLRCSVTTVYTYRSKVRRRALDPENFESAIKDIE